MTTAADEMNEALKAIRTLQKDNARLREALADAQELNAGLERDKDNAHMLFQLLLDHQPGRVFSVTPLEMREYSPRQWYVERQATPSGIIQYKLKDK